MSEYAPIVDGESGASVRGKLNAALAQLSLLGPANSQSDGLMSAADKEKLDGIAETIAGAIPGAATVTTPGLMSAADKDKLDRLDELIDESLTPILTALTEAVG